MQRNSSILIHHHIDTDPVQISHKLRIVLQVILKNDPQLRGKHSILLTNGSEHLTNKIRSCFRSDGFQKFHKGSRKKNQAVFILKGRFYHQIKNLFLLLGVGRKKERQLTTLRQADNKIRNMVIFRVNIEQELEEI